MDNGDRQLLVRIDERVNAILEKLEVGERRMNDYSRRIRALEGWRWFLAGGLVLLGILLRLLKA
jgi:hypothetical protein